MFRTSTVGSEAMGAKIFFKNGLVRLAATSNVKHFLDPTGWLVQDIRMMRLEGEPLLTAQDWGMVQLSIMKVHEQWIDRLVNMETPLQVWTTFTVETTFFDQTLQCGVVHLQGADKVSQIGRSVRVVKFPQATGGPGCSCKWSLLCTLSVFQSYVF
jgi:hypothetical protein